mmetsp:Transcript_5927/g.17060  ORF Transcript_5927/g.17060 Transcript_5927/m.17060 type:complete len:236 (-) Transcript_5927:3274-3981(-)
MVRGGSLLAGKGRRRRRRRRRSGVAPRSRSAAGRGRGHELSRLYVHEDGEAALRGDDGIDGAVGVGHRAGDPQGRRRRFGRRDLLLLAGRRQRRRGRRRSSRCIRPHVVRGGRRSSRRADLRGGTGGDDDVVVVRQVQHRRIRLGLHPVVPRRIRIDRRRISPGRRRGKLSLSFRIRVPDDGDDGGVRGGGGLFEVGPRDVGPVRGGGRRRIDCGGCERDDDDHDHDFGHRCHRR